MRDKQSLSSKHFMACELT